MKKIVNFEKDDIFEEIAKILQENGVQETVDDFVISDDDEKSAILTTIDLAEQWASGEIDEKAFISQLEKELPNPTAAAGVARGIKEKILPSAEVVEVKPQVQQPKEPQKPKIQSSAPKVNTESVGSEEETKPAETQEKRLPKEIFQQQKPTPSRSGNDSYREPIE